jgi:cell division FtsZ-interacting protein ZapD
MKDSYSLFTKVNFHSLHKLQRLDLELSHEERWCLKQIGNLLQNNRSPHVILIRLSHPRGSCSLDDLEALLAALLKLAPNCSKIEVRCHLFQMPLSLDQAPHLEIKLHENLRAHFAIAFTSSRTGIKVQFTALQKQLTLLVSEIHIRQS